MRGYTNRQCSLDVLLHQKSQSEQVATSPTSSTSPPESPTQVAGYYPRLEIPWPAPPSSAAPTPSLTPLSQSPTYTSSLHSPSTTGTPSLSHSFSSLNFLPMNIYKLATAIPSLRSYTLSVPGSRYRHASPAPASSSTETKKRSIKQRVSSISSQPSCLQLSSALATRGTLPTSKCCQRPWGGMVWNLLGP